jgi:CO/xanthine dehydrogenase Mo-binding subunit
MRNAIDDQTVTFLGYPVAETVGFRECLEAVRPYYHDALHRARQETVSHAMPGACSEQDAWQPGVGLAAMWYRFGKAGRLTCEAQAELELDGQISLFFTAPDYGQGTATVMAQIAAEALHIPRDSLRLVNADTATTPDSDIPGASRSTYWVGGAVAQAATLLRERLLRAAAELLDSPPSELQLAPPNVCTRDGRGTSLADLAAEMERAGLLRRLTGVFSPRVGFETSQDNLPFFVTGVHLAEVRVNVRTGEVDVERIVAVHDVGRIINPQAARGQVEGAVMMGLGAALMEEYLPGVSAGLADYYLPTVRAMPEIEVHFVEVPSRWGPHGAKGLGEAAALPTTPAILNAVYHASGARIRRLPATPERVLAALRAQGSAAACDRPRSRQG